MTTSAITQPVLRCVIESTATSTVFVVSRSSFIEQLHIHINAIDCRNTLNATHYTYSRRQNVPLIQRSSRYLTCTTLEAALSSMSSLHTRRRDTSDYYQ